MMRENVSFLFFECFPPQDFKRGDVRHFLISSPDEHLLVVFKDKLTQLKRMNVGEMSFSIKGVSLLRPKVTRACTLITGTPIIIRIPRENYDKYGIRPPKDYTYLYWRKNYPFNAFVKQLEDNLIKKYNEFYGVSLSEVPLFEQFVFKKQVCNHIIIKGKEVKVFGSNWKFIFNYLSGEQRRII
jgi:CRISPR-associated endoribonuclease Cas6